MFWKIYTYASGMLIFTQLFFFYQMVRNYIYVIKKHFREELSYRPRTLLTVPCKGIDKEFEKNIKSFYEQDYDNYYLHFVVESGNDAAYGRLCELKEKFGTLTKAFEVRILVSGISSSCSQKLHNMLCSCNSAKADVEAMAFADSDACLRPEWLRHIVYPLRKDKNGAITGYRWFVPLRNNFASLLLSEIGRAHV